MEVRSRRVSSSRAIAAPISSGWVSHNRVEPSTSASSNVTVPVGSPLTPRSLQFTGGASARGSLMLVSVWQTGVENISENAYTAGRTATLTIKTGADPHR
jgi:hypothetical protein